MVYALPAIDNWNEDSGPLAEFFGFTLDLICWLGDSPWKTVVTTTDFHLIAYEFDTFPGDAACKCPSFVFVTRIVTGMLLGND